MPIRAYYNINVNQNKDTASVRKQAQRIVKSAKRSMLLAKFRGNMDDVARYNMYMEIANKGIERAKDINMAIGRSKRLLSLVNG